MTKEQQIYKNMKLSHRIYKSRYSKYFIIPYSALYCAISDAGYREYATIHTVINNMVKGGYIAQCKNGVSLAYRILKWVNFPKEEIK